MRASLALSLRLATLALACATAPALAEQAEVLRSVAELTAGLERHDGLLSFFLDRNQGKLWLELPAPDETGKVGEFLHVEALVGGLGSNPIGLDRGQLGRSRVIRLRRIGPRVLVEAPNLSFRARSADPLERRAVAESFATSVLWGGTIEALDADGRALVDLSSFILRDAHGVVRTLKRSDQGSFQLDSGRSAIELNRCHAFPDNLVFEALVSFSSSEPGSEVRSIAPAAESLSLVQRQLIVRLPPDGYTPRRFDPRAGVLEISFRDYAAPLDASIETRWIVRHRLHKLEPEAARSRAVKPIVYYVDRGAPEPVRSALVEGAGWWNRAFEEAGFVDAFRAELLPEDVHPLDVRYNVIQWVHRATRGWSYGGGVIDPRTGERIKGHVSLGSLRVRHDRRLFEGLAGTEQTGSGAADDPIELALARIRQLAAHEVGHTLGFAHNFAASSYGRASVMDYPAPLVTIDGDGGLDFSAAYGAGVGAWDIQTVRYAYSHFADGVDESAALEAIVAENLRRDLVFLSDADARPAGAAHPRASLWDNSADPVAELESVLAVRRLALGRFDEGNVKPGTPLAILQETLAPVYFYHRYQLQAAAKVLGGMEYRHAVRGDGPASARPLHAVRQRAAVAAMLGILSPRELNLPEPLLELLLPRPQGYGSNRELFRGRTAPAFDPLAAAATAAEQVVAALLEPHRAARLVDFARRDPRLPGLEEVLEALTAHAFDGPRVEDSRQAELVRVIQASVVNGLLRLAANQDAAPGVRAEGQLKKLASELEDGDAHLAWLRRSITRYLERTEHEGERFDAPALPPGSPIGDAEVNVGCSFE